MMKEVEIILFLLLVSSAYAYDQTIEFNVTELPFQGAEPMALGLEQNYSIFLTQYLTDDKVTLDFPSEYYYNNTSTSNFKINYSIGYFDVIQDTTLEVALNITSDHPGFTDGITYGMIFNLKKNIDLVDQNSTDLFYLLDQGYGFNISTNLLPTERSFNFSLSGEPNNLVNVTQCDDWLICPESFSFEEDGSKKLKIGIIVPKNASVGSYERRFILKSGNITNIGKIIVNIVEPDFIFQEYVFKESCFESEIAMADCLREQAEFNNQKMADFYARYIASKENLTQVIYNETEVLVMTGSIDDELNNLYQKQGDLFQTCQNDKVELNNENEALRQEQKDLNAQIRRAEANCSSTLESEMQEKQEFRSKVWHWCLLIIAIVLIIGASAGYSHWYKNKNFG